MSDKRFEITRSPQHKPRKRIVTEDYFARSSAFYPVLQLDVGAETPPNQYRSAGLWRIKRIS